MISCISHKKIQKSDETSFQICPNKFLSQIIKGYEIFHTQKKRKNKNVLFYRDRKKEERNYNEIYSCALTRTQKYEGEKKSSFVEIKMEV